MKSGASLLFAFFAVFALCTPSASAANLYDRMLDITRKEFLLNGNGQVEGNPQILRAVSQMLPLIGLNADVGAKEVENLLNEGQAVCEAQGLNIGSECPGVRETARMLVQRETEVESAATDWQIIASSMEEPMLGGFGLSFTGRLQGIGRLWSADARTEADEPDASAIRTEAVPGSDELAGMLRELATALNALTERVELDDAEPPRTALDRSALIAAVWRYRFTGALWLSGKRDDLPRLSADSLDPRPQTEQALLRGEYLSVREPLAALAESVREQARTLDIADGETVLFTYPPELTRLLPDNIRVWTFVEKKDGELVSDAGLQFEHALEPAPLALCADNSDGASCTPIPGGRYPPPPEQEETTPVCAFPLMRDGLLCGDNGADAGNPCLETVDPLPGTIQLAACTGTEPQRVVPGGGDTCDFGGQEDDAGDRDAVCTPGQETRYLDTIGNAVCYMNRCFTQSFSDHRVVPGRTPVTAGDNPYPFDACMKPDPGLGSLSLGESSGAQWTPPPYRPALLLRELEETLCPGQPLGSPLCMFNPSRRLDLPLATGFQLFSDLADQDREFQEPKTALADMADAIGIRIGTRLTNDLLERKARGITDFVRGAELLLSQFPAVTFPTELCPLNAAEDPLCLPTDAR